MIKKEDFPKHFCIGLLPETDDLQYRNFFFDYEGEFDVFYDGMMLGAWVHFGRINPDNTDAFLTYRFCECDFKLNRKE